MVFDFFKSTDASPYCMGLISCADQAEAAKIAHALVEEKLAACVSRLGPMASVYTWQDKLQEACEYLLLAKTTKKAFPELVARVKALHSYDEPEVIALPITGGSSTYLNWLTQNVHL